MRKICKWELLGFNRNYTSFYTNCKLGLLQNKPYRIDNYQLGKYAYCPACGGLIKIVNASNEVKEQG